MWESMQLPRLPKRILKITTSFECSSVFSLTPGILDQLSNLTSPNLISPSFLGRFLDENVE